MTSRQATVDFLVGQMASAGSVSARRMFGEFAVYCDGKLVALVCDDRLFVKPTAVGRSRLGTPPEAPPYPGAKPCFVIPGGDWDDADALAALIKATAGELPTPVKKASVRKAPVKKARGSEPT